ncbi:XRE family transcriptional regulator [Sandaracinobacter neustonicus]|uniref:XRE family transcriptional regulator n=1 Tax=Sandaracinobacter neustonicus TaxID=1715348 RepID=A0A501XUA5_9SPHN|nr:XRE family transcriptional regulator [Sandaracinobacter neustonicus]TPE63704.1 XRE family transcriptional regulator [Sandaracinobacter neustonicus]
MADTRTGHMPAVLAELRRQLRGAGYTIKAAAQALGVAEATLKRWLAGHGMTVDKLDDLCLLADTSLPEIIRLIDQPVRLKSQLTLAQETALVSDPFMTLMFFAILGGWSPEELLANVDMPEAEIEQRLSRLERLALIDRLPGGRIRCRIDRKVRWRRHLMGAQFERYVKRQFVELDYSSSQVFYQGEIIRLSLSGYSRLAELIERVRVDTRAIEDEDRHNTRLESNWYVTLFAVRELDLSRLRAYVVSGGVNMMGDDPQTPAP